jgi:nitrogen fixation NifU-like protein
MPHRSPPPVPEGTGIGGAREGAAVDQRAEATTPINPAKREALYQELVLEHFRHPHGKGVLASADASATVRNSLCGEEITVSISVDRASPSPVIRDVRFTGDGCSISQASASMMTDMVRGRSREEINALTAALRALVLGDTVAGQDIALGPLRALSGVARVPARVRCALMAWEALGMAFASGSNHGS